MVAYKDTVGKDLSRLGKLESAVHATGRGVVGPGLGLLFLVLVWISVTAVTSGTAGALVVTVAAIVGGYMALNIGANDVANNVGPAVGARALTMAGALIIAAVFETAGALIAGGDVVSTISKGIVDPAVLPDTSHFIWAMLAALLAAALWINLATWVGAPVSTTHSVVGGVMGGGIAAAGVDAVDWGTMGAIAASWVISPVLGGIVAALFLAFIKYAILYKRDKVAAARRWVPLLVALMSGVFSAYLVMKGLKHIWKANTLTVVLIGVAMFGATWAVVAPIVRSRSARMENRNKSVRQLFTLPLICAAALLSFAHGANDVANAVGPLAAVVHAAGTGAIAAKVTVPSWVMLVGALGISIGLLLFGPKVIRTVGDKITKLNPMRAYCVALSAAITVIVASAMGLPVSSTHIAVGGVFGVGFFREFLAARRAHIGYEKAVERAAHVDPFVGAAPYAASDDLSSKEVKRLARGVAEVDRKLSRAQRRKLVRRQHVATIAAAWVITVPLSAFLAAGLYLILDRITQAY